MDLGRELKETVEKVRSGKDEDWKKNLELINAFPTWMLSIIAETIGIIGGDMGIGIPQVGLKAKQFGKE